jgi:hypothetical protein
LPFVDTKKVAAETFKVRTTTRVIKTAQWNRFIMLQTNPDQNSFDMIPVK